MSRQTQPENPRPSHLRVLLAETPPGEIGEALRSLFADAPECLELTTVSAASMLIPTLQLTRPEVAFVDLALHSVEPLSLVRSLHRAIPDVPLIALVDSVDKDIAEQTLREGAANYLLKGHSQTHLIDRVLRAALERNTMTGLSDLLRDGATRLYNRDGFCALATRAVQFAHKSGGRMILLIAEIENLKALLREFGPSGSDQAVRDTAALLRGSFRKTDVAARWNETQFVILALDALEPTAALLRQRVERHLTALNVSRAPWGEIILRLSTAFWNAASEEPFQELESLTGITVPSAGADNREEPSNGKLRDA